MKGLFVTLLVLSLASASNFLEVQDGLEAQEGTQCIPNPLYNVTSFDVTPWPPVINQNLVINMTGVFLANVYVENLSVGTNFNRQNWNWQHSQLNHNFTQGQVYSFIVNTQAGQQSGKYLKQVVLSNQDNHQNYQHISCWQFLYSL